jgi:hypothetical protein
MSGQVAVVETGYVSGGLDGLLLRPRRAVSVQTLIDIARRERSRALAGFDPPSVLTCERPYVLYTATWITLVNNLICRIAFFSEPSVGDLSDRIPSNFFLAEFPRPHGFGHAWCTTKRCRAC